MAGGGGASEIGYHLHVRNRLKMRTGLCVDQILKLKSLRAFTLSKREVFIKWRSLFSEVSFEEYDPFGGLSFFWMGGGGARVSVFLVILFLWESSSQPMF